MYTNNMLYMPPPLYTANHAHRCTDGNQCTNVSGLALATISSTQYCIYQSRRIGEPYMHYLFLYGYLTLQPNKAIGTENAYIQQSVMTYKQN